MSVDCAPLTCNANLTLELDEIAERHAAAQAGLDALWVMFTAIGILSMQVGFCLLEAGVAQVKNVKAILIKNFLDNIIGTIVWWLVGFGIFFGPSPFMGSDLKLYSISIRHSAGKFFPIFTQQFGFAITAGTIVSGGIMSRIKLEMYMLFTVFFVGITYPFVAHWGFNTEGFLNKFGYVDFAGSGIVHMLGGWAGLMGAYMCGPRLERFVELPGKGTVPRPIKKHSTVLIVHGAFMLFIGWFSFNAGSSGGLGTALQLELASKAMINTLLASCASGATSTLYTIARRGQHDIPFVMNGFICGLVAITAPCAFVETWAAIFIGAVAALLAIPSSDFILRKLLIDDPLDVGVVHGIAGMWGILCLGFFHTEKGIFYGGGGHLMIAQLAGFLVITSWVIVWSYGLFKALDLIWGLRVPDEVLREGLDKYYHKGNAYTFDTLAVGQKSEMDRHKKKFTAFHEAEEIAKQNLREALIKTDH